MKHYNIPRRRQLDLCEPVEIAITNAMYEVEETGTDERLTKAVILLAEARELVSDYIDEQRIVLNL